MSVSKSTATGAESKYKFWLAAVVVLCVFFGFIFFGLALYGYFLSGNTLVEAAYLMKDSKAAGMEMARGYRTISIGMVLYFWGCAYVIARRLRRKS